MHRTIRAALQEGYHRSPTLRHVLLRLDESSVVVYVVAGFCEVTRLDGCLLGHVTIAGNTRYLRIVVNPHKPLTELIARIGHELQHALEVAAAPEAVDAASMLALFKRIASGTCRGVLVDCYETQAAVEVEDRVLKELNSGGSSGVGCLSTNNFESRGFSKDSSWPSHRSMRQEVALGLTMISARSKIRRT